MSSNRIPPKMRFKKASYRPFSHKPTNFHPLLFQNPGYPNGDTLLHIAIRNTPTIAGIDELIQKMGLEVVTAMSVITNDDGKLPIHLINSSFTLPSNITQDDLDNLRTKLLDLMNNYHIKKLDEKLSNHEVVLDINQQNTRLINNLKIGTDISNATRNIILESGSHPQLNNYNKTRQEKVLQLVDEMRNKTDYAPVTTDEVENITHYTSQYKTGNCYEFSYVALGILRKTDPGLCGEIFSIHKGDHVFLVIDRDRDSDVTNPATWGDNAVVCDAWSGSVYPATEIPIKLKNFSQYILEDESILNVLSSFNPRFHELTCQYPISQKKNQSPKL